MILLIQSLRTQPTIKRFEQLYVLKCRCHTRKDIWSQDGLFSNFVTGEAFCSKIKSYHIIHNNWIICFSICLNPTGPANGHHGSSFFNMGHFLKINPKATFHFTEQGKGRGGHHYLGHLREEADGHRQRQAKGYQTHQTVHGQNQPPVGL